MWRWLNRIHFFFKSGVFACETIKKGTCFGPYKGSIVRPNDITTGGVVLHMKDSWEIFKNGFLSHFIHPTATDHCWMKLINCARYGKEQNLGVLQKNCQIFYEVLEDIQAGTELLVWYGDTYAEYMGLPLAIKPTNKHHTLLGADPQQFQCSNLITDADETNVDRSLMTEPSLSGKRNYERNQKLYDIYFEGFWFSNL